eukprot:TRINITY_DN12187_c0_g1_i1.p1 TRINITY_DN12187_c0_g1~~TRINITY_DN12187_c0_g1_i1.p1  ORF type:complete len:1503 (+),score=258.15 TRINITY_DN12187_c0_g1_i1:257-4510(+)
MNRPTEQKFRRLKKNRPSDVPQEQQLKKDLFGSDDEEDVEEPNEETPHFNNEELEYSDDDDINHFMVDDPEEDNFRRSNQKRVSHSSITPNQLMEATSIFYTSKYQTDAFETDEYDDYAQRKPKKKTDKLSYYKERFEPSLLEERYFTIEDEKIKDTDVPERLQLRFPNRDLPQEGECHQEATWIYETYYSSQLPRNVVPKITAILDFLRRECYEIPFVASYRREYFEPELNLHHLWEIYDYDEKWHHFETSKNNLRKLIEQAPAPELEDEEIFQSIEKARTEEEFADLYDHYQLHYSAENGPTGNSRHKRPIKRDPYRLLKKSGIMELVKQFGLSAKEFGDNLAANVQLFEPSDNPNAPLYIAQVYTQNGEFSDPESVLKACRLILAKEVAYDPHVRQALRPFFYERATVTTQPTLKGKKEIDEYHVYMGIKRLYRKPYSEFRSGHQFLEILKAEKEGFIEVSIDLPQEDQEGFRDIENLYLSTRYSNITHEWNEQRKLVLKEAFENQLIPLFIKEIRRKLLNDASERVAKECADRLKNKIFCVPPRPNHGVLSCCWGNDIEPTVCAFLNPEGEMLEHIRLSFMNSRVDEFAAEVDKARKQKDLARIKEMVSKYSPDVVIIGTTDLNAQRFKEEMVEVVKDVRRGKEIPVLYVDLEVARAVKSSTFASTNHADISPIVRQAMSLGRYYLDPLTQVATLCTESDEILCLHFHPLQEMLNRDLLLKNLNRVFMEVVARVGVDLNKAVMHKHAATTLQFIPGLGPRKVADLLQNLSRKATRTTHRKELTGLLGRCVYQNCVAYLRICREYFNTETDLDPLDDTRVHPDDYYIARKMASTAVETEVSSEQDLIAVVEELIDMPKHRKSKCLEEIDLDTFAEEWERKGKGKKSKTLYDIKKELISPFDDPRDPFAEPTIEVLFSLLTGESDQTLQINQPIVARIVAVNSERVTCKLDSGLTAIIDRFDLSDDSERIEKGSTIACRVKSVEKSTFNVYLTQKESSDHPLNFDPYLKIDSTCDEPIQESSQSLIPKPARVSSASAALNRHVAHPLFKNLSYPDAERFLTERESNFVIIRPSSKGLDHLTVSWKFHDLFIHIDILEKDKTNLFSLGKSLYIGKEKFEDLNEIIARFVDPIIMYSQEMSHSKFFQLGREETIIQSLREEKSRNTARIPYRVGLSYQYPGRFILYYIPNRSCRKEIFSVTPEGFRLRQKIFKTPEKMIQWFKMHYKEPIPREPKPRYTDSAYPLDSSNSNKSDSTHNYAAPTSNYYSNSNADSWDLETSDSGNSLPIVGAPDPNDWDSGSYSAANDMPSGTVPYNASSYRGSVGNDWGNNGSNTSYRGNPNQSISSGTGTYPVRSAPSRGRTWEGSPRTNDTWDLPLTKETPEPGIWQNGNQNLNNWPAPPSRPVVNEQDAWGEYN